MSIVEKFFQAAARECVPLVTTLEITQSCNYRCHHCYNFDRTKEMPAGVKEKSLTPDEILKIIDQIGTSGALYLNLTGGEALLHPHLDEFISRASAHHLEVRLKTNGALLSSDRCIKLDAAGLSGMDVSLYGFSETSYQKITGKTGVFQKSVDGIRTAVNQGFNVNVSIILHRYNIDEIRFMINFCREINVPFQFSTEITERYDSSKGAKDFEITAEQFETQLRGEFSEIFMKLNPEKCVQCSCAKTVCGISSTGEVYPCIGAPVPSGNLRAKSFDDIWKNSEVLNSIRSLKKEDFESCMECEHIEFCSRSSGTIYSNTKNYTGCDESTFEQARIRHEYFLSKS